ncbi:unnamed protein product [Orchesella dallaii]|uniref:Gustatory receptor n=1 Tax=Orchesella dallaii TaxID=48710 RepID=A0ABP1R0G3_9HEXA
MDALFPELKAFGKLILESFHRNLKRQTAPVRSNIIETHLKWHLNLCETAGLSPYSWDSNTQRVIINGRHSQLGKKYIGLIMYIAIFLAMFYETIVYGYGGSTSTPNENQQLLNRLVFMTTYGGCGLYFIFNENHSREFLALINELMSKFERNPTFGRINIKVMRFALRLHLMSLILPFGIMMMMVMAPKMPPFPTCLVYKTEFGDYSWTTLMLRIILTVLQMWTFALYVFDGYLILLGALLSTIGLWTGVLALKRSNADLKLDKRLQQYRMIQLLVCYTNACFQKTIFLGLTVVTILANIVSLAAFITYHGSLAPSILTGLVLIIVEVTGIAVFVYKILGMVNQVSKEVTKGWTQRVGIRGVRQKLESRMVKSCSEIKIKFGEVSYFEARTSLVILDFQVEKAINLILLSRKH